MCESQGNVVVVLTGWTVLDSISSRGKRRLFSSREHSDELWGPRSLLFSGKWCYFLGVTWPRRGFDHWPPSGIETKNGWSYTSTLSIRFLGVERGKFTFTCMNRYKRFTELLLCPSQVTNILVWNHLHSSTPDLEWGISSSCHILSCVC